LGAGPESIHVVMDSGLALRAPRNDELSIAAEAVVTVVIAAATAASIDTKHAPDAANSRSDARADRAADNRTNGTRRAAALAYAFPGALLRAAENALGVAGVRKCKQR
jgi:hypothetical protein